MSIQLDLIDLIKELEFELNCKLHTLSINTFLKWSDLLNNVVNDYVYSLLKRLFNRSIRRFEKLGLATPA